MKPRKKKKSTAIALSVLIIWLKMGLPSWEFSLSDLTITLRHCPNK